MRVNSRIFGAIFAGSAALLLVAACGSNLPKDPGLLQEDLGFGLTLGMPASAARELSPPGDVELTVVTGEEFASSNPYEDRPGDSELLVAVISSGSERLFSDGLDVLDPVVSIKGFLREAGPSSFTLFDQNLADLTPEGLTGLLGEPASLVNSTDGSTHVSFAFASAQLRQRYLAAMFSHHSDGRCYAFELSLSVLN